MVLNGILTRRTYQTLGAFTRDGFHTERRSFREAYFCYAHLLVQKFVEFICFGRTCLPLSAGIYIFRVLAKDVHVDLLGLFHRRNDPSEPANRTKTHI